MKKIGLSVYAVHVNDKGKGDKTNANNLIHKKSFVELVKDFYERNKDRFSDDPVRENVFKFVDVQYETVKRDGADLYTYITGTVNTGEYGLEAELVNHTTGEQSKTKTVDEAEVMPFSFYIGFPSGKCNMGIAIFQTEGRYGMKSVFENRFRKYIRGLDKDVNFSFANLAPKYYVENILKNGYLKQLRLIKYNLNEDMAERLKVNNGVEVREERIFHNPGGFIINHLDAIQKKLSGQNGQNKVVSIPDFDYDCLKFVMKSGDREKTINMDNLESVVITIDITEDVGRDRMHPLPYAVQNCMKETALEYMERIEILR